MTSKKIAWIDTETGGTNPETDALLQIAIIISIDGKDVESQVFHCAPFEDDCVHEEALKVNGFKLVDVMNFLPPMIVHMRLTKMLERYIDKYSAMDKFVFAGYGARFDMDFLRQFFLKNDDQYFGSYFFSLPMDVMSFVAEGIRLGTVKPMKSFKLGKVCEQLGVPLGEDAHDAMADIVATREVYGKLETRKYEELYAPRFQ